MKERRRTKSGEQWKDDYFPLGGGLDQTSSGLSKKPGRMEQGSNFEEVFGKQGYRSIKGYERYSGQNSPSACSFAVQPFDTGTIAITAGNEVANQVATAFGYVVSVTVTSGSFGGGDAAGYLILTNLVGSWANNDQIRVSGVQRALASDITEPGSVGFAGYEAALRSAREALRALINKPVGDGPILGVAVYNEAVYCVRNVAGNASATLWKSSGIGWQSIQTGLHAGGAYKFEVANFSGSSTTKALFGVSGKGRLFKVDSAGTFTYAAPIFGSEATSTDNETVGTGNKSFTLTETLRNFASGDIVTAWKIGDSSVSMTGPFVSYAANVLTINVTDTTGSGAHTGWELGLASFRDKPFELAEHKDHMFLAYPLGQLQSSDLGNPMTYTTTAALFGIGDEITDLTSLKGEMLGVFAREKIKLLSGSSSLDWDLGTHTKDVGAVAGTVQDNSGNAIFLDDKGITTLQGTLNFGDFEGAILSANAKTTLDAKRELVVGSRMAKNSYQYRLYFSDGSNLRCTIRSGNAVLTPKDVSFTPHQYDHVPTCFTSGTLSDGQTHMFFGTDDGWVMEEDAGTSYDGAAIIYVVRLPFNHGKSPGVEKRWVKMDIEIENQDAVTIYFRQIFNYDDGTYMHGGTQSVDVQETGGQFDVSSFDTFSFDRPTVSKLSTDLNGVGENMALLIFFESDFVRPVNLQGILQYFIRLGLKR